jgi:hypothetical protein
VVAELWSHRDLVDKVFDIDDLLDAHEILQVKYENQCRADEAQQRRD